jgi:hypothetical protein
MESPPVTATRKMVKDLQQPGAERSSNTVSKYLNSPLPTDTDSSADRSGNMWLEQRGQTKPRVTASRNYRNDTRLAKRPCKGVSKLSNDCDDVCMPTAITTGNMFISLSRRYLTWTNIKASILWVSD